MRRTSASRRSSWRDSNEAWATTGPRSRAPMLLRCSSARAYAVVLETAPLQRLLVLRTNASSKIVFYYRFMHNSASSTTLVRTTSRITVHFLSRKWPPEVPYPQKFPLRGLFVGCALSGATKISISLGGRAPKTSTVSLNMRKSRTLARPSPHYKDVGRL